MKYIGISLLACVMCISCGHTDEKKQTAAVAQACEVSTCDGVSAATDVVADTLTRRDTTVRRHRHIKQ